MHPHPVKQPNRRAVPIGLRHQVCTLDALAVEVARARRRVLSGAALKCTQ